MRPEYIDAVDAVRFGWSLWLTLLLPAAIIWYAVLARPFPKVEDRAAIGCGGVAVGCILFWSLFLVHVERVQSAKEFHMQTETEQRDFGADVGVTFAPATAILAAAIYCMINLVAANLMYAIVGWFSRWRAGGGGLKPQKRDKRPETS